MMATIPFAEKKLIPPGENDPRIKARIGILHVDDGNVADLYDFFKNRSGGIESHGHVRKDGHLYQYRDLDFEADANYKANPFALSFETQGLGEGEWTPAQLNTIKAIMLWCRDERGIPLRKVTSWNDPVGGWGYHILFDEWHPKAKSCPGPDRIKQFDNVLVPWMREQNQPKPPAEEELDVDVQAEVRAAIFGIKVPAPPGSKAEKHYGKGAKLSLPNAVYWALAESVGDAEESTLQEIAAALENQ